MLQSISHPPSHALGLPSKRETDLKLSLPTKRKRDLICGLGPFTASFSIKPSPDSSYEKSTTFKPVRTIARIQLPWTFLDRAPASSSLPTPLFTSYIGILENQNSNNSGQPNVPRVLIARNEATKALYVVERIETRLYSLCKLAGWVKEKEVAELWDPSTINLFPALQHVETKPEGPAQWWQNAVVARDTEMEQDIKPAKRVRISMLRPKDASVELPSEVDNNIKGKEVPGVSLQHPSESVSPQQMCENLVQQYLETVYLSKTSLAYFAKGPISRIRSAFTSTESGAPPTHELVLFFRSMLLSHKVYDKKFREKLPEVIKAIPPGSLSDDDLAEGNAKPRKSKKKIKLSKDGIYPHEQDIVRKWWISELPSPDQYGEETLDQRIRRRVQDLRIRETLAQLILMLEILALEALSTYKVPEEDVSAHGDDQGASNDSKPKANKRKKKLDDINLLIDLLVDKLCIWQSVDQDDVISFDASTSQYGGGETSGNKSNGDRLQGFCVEVIVPFYMSRLPEKAKMINKAFGGPVQHSPPKRKAVKPPSKKGGESKEPETKKSRRTLGRVATDTAAQATLKKPTRSLNRSTTEPQLFSGIKREGSEVPLSAIPFQRSPSAATRQSMAAFKQLTRREIDLAPTAAATAKLRQKKRVEEDLKEAISALKKPNRGLALGGYADELDKRKLGSGTSNRSKKQANPVRRLAKDVLVSETPRAVRRAPDMVEDTPARPRNPFLSASKGDTPSSTSCVPSSTVRPSSFMVSGTTSRSGTRQNAVVSTVSETPSKAPSARNLFSSEKTSSTAVKAFRKLPPPFKLAAPKFSDDAPERQNDAVFETPSRPRSQHHDVEPPKGTKAMFSTPVKSSTTTFSVQTSTSQTRTNIFSTPVKGNASVRVMETKQTTAVFSTPLKSSTFHTTNTTGVLSTPEKSEAVIPPPLANSKDTAIPEDDQDIFDALGWNDDDL